ncbi:cupin [Halorussus salilacus]|uniref:cupin domain-containing protein n=1 Tax=Halorussus salilacus TaxID=2953750 RepID=UPI00209D2D75|nr:cupin domain-containing protein [Halorussus salilacus]USZ67313.1 cupin [Halorussus salilacus]
MERVTIGNADSGGSGGGIDRRDLSASLGTTGLALVRYRLAPGGGFPSGLHAHADQEEVFVVIEGEATFETLAAPRGGAASDSGDENFAPETERDENFARDSGTEGDDDFAPVGREVVVGEGEAIRFAPGEFQSGRNAADRDLVALAVGAPRDTEDVRLPVACPECDRADVRLETGDEGVRFVCPDCGAERVPAPCPDCECEEMRLALDDTGRVVATCEDCETEFDDPPVRD